MFPMNTCGEFWLLTAIENGGAGRLILWRFVVEGSHLKERPHVKQSIGDRHRVAGQRDTVAGEIQTSFPLLLCRHDVIRSRRFADNLSQTIGHVGEPRQPFEQPQWT